MACLHSCAGLVQGALVASNRPGTAATNDYGAPATPMSPTSPTLLGAPVDTRNSTMSGNSGASVSFSTTKKKAKWGLFGDLIGAN